LAFELQIANRRESKRRYPSSKALTAFTPASRIEIVGDLTERSSVLAAERIDNESATCNTAILVSLERVSRTQWSALHRLVAKIQAARRLGLDVRMVKPKPSIRLLLGTMAFGESLFVETSDLQIARSVIIA
jgi:anti-anti-sigma regulatory factor